MTRSPVALVAATLAVVSTAAPALAQPGAEFEIGGGYQQVFDIGDLFTVPSAATVDARVTNWSGRWGVAARALVGLGGVLRGYGVERRHPTIFQVLVRHRSVGPGGTGLHLGIGGGFIGFQETLTKSGIQEFRVGVHLVAIEALGSKTLTDRLSIRGGVHLIVPFQVNPTVLLAWGF